MKGGRFPRKIKVIMITKEDCKKVLENSESASLSNNVRITRDMTFNQRQEARFFRLEEEEKEKEREGITIPPFTQGGGGGGRGGGKGRGRGKAPGDLREVEEEE